MQGRGQGQGGLWAVCGSREGAVTSESVQKLALRSIQLADRLPILNGQRAFHAIQQQGGQLAFIGGARPAWAELLQWACKRIPLH